MKTLDHRFKSAKADGPDASQVQPSHWNDGHTFIGGAAGDVLTRDPNDAQYGAGWTARDTAATWTPIDVSGAGLIFTTPQGRSLLTGRLLYIWASLSFPFTSDGTPARIGGLPYPMSVGFTSGFYQTFGITHSLHISNGATSLFVLNPTSLTQRTNADLSGQSLMFAGAYPIVPI